MLVSRCKKAGQRQSIRTANRSFEDVARLKYMGTTILKGSDDGVMHIEESCFWTISTGLVIETSSKGPHRVGATPSPHFYLKTEAESASETLFI
jgi:hypothetical protein